MRPKTPLILLLVFLQVALFIVQIATGAWQLMPVVVFLMSIIILLTVKK